MRDGLQALAILLIAGFFLSFDVEPESNLESLTGMVISEDVSEEKIVNNDESIEVSKNSLKECCSFIDDNGKEKSCFAVGRFTCNYCNNVC